MSNQETSFVTLGQRVLASPLKWVVKNLSYKKVIELTYRSFFQDSVVNFLAVFTLKKVGGSGEKLNSTSLESVGYEFELLIRTL